MRHNPEKPNPNPEPSVRFAPVPDPVSIPVPVPQPASKPAQKLVLKKTKIKNLPNQVGKQKERKLVNDQLLLEQLRAKLKVNIIDSYPEKSETLKVSDPVPVPEPESELTLHRISVDPEASSIKPLLFLQARVNDADIHFLIDSGATGNFLSRALVQLLDIKTTILKNPIHVSFADGRTQSINRYCLARIPFHPNYQPILKFFVADIAHNAYLGQPWLTSDDISINWSTGVVQVGSNVEFRGVRKKDGKISLMSACQFKKTMKKEQAYLCLVRQKDSDEDKPDPATLDPNIQSLLDEYSDVFPDELPKELPPERTVDHRIDLLPDSAPISKPTYKMSLAEMDELRRQLDDLLERGFIRPSSSPYGSPVLFVKKKEGDLRLCVDYRALNKQTVKNTYPLPRIDELLDRLKGAIIFSKIDLRSGYHQIRVQEIDIYKTAFRSRYGLFEFVVLPFGLCNAPATFMRLMNDVFRDELDRCALIYLDDILVFSPSIEQHLRDLRIILEKLRQHRLYAKLSKCEFLKKEIRFLGHLISADGLKMDPDKVKAILEWPELKNEADVLSFLGLVNFYHKYLEHLADVAIPISDLLKDENPFVWGPEQSDAFNKLKQLVASDPILSHFDVAEPVEVHCDASNRAVGAMLVQKGHPVAFESRKLSATELNYPTHDKELLAIVHALTKWRTYLHGSTIPIKIFTDHESLKCLATQPTLNHRQARWLEKLAEYNYEIAYTPGPENIVPDALSRRPDHNLAAMTESSPIIGLPFLESVRSKTPDDKDFGPIVTRLKNDADPHSAYRLENDILFLREGERMCIPNDPEIKTILLQEVHDSALAGHPGLDKTYTRLAQIAYWPNMRKSVEKYVKSCHTCRVSKIQTSKPNGLLQPLPIPERPWTHIAMDLMVHLPKTDRQNDAVAVFVDRFSKAAHFVACQTTCTAQDLAELFFKSVVRLHGLPISIVSDRDSRFCSRFWSELFSRLGTRLDMSTAHHQQTDGQAERTIQTLEQYLRIFINKDHKNWDELLGQAEFTYNSNKSASTNLSPFEAMNGYQPLTPVSIALTRPDNRIDKEADNFLRNHTTRFHVIRDALLDAQRRMASQYDEHRKEVTFKVGDLVYLDASDLKKPPGLAHKLLPRYRGPFKILEQPSPLNYRLDLPPKSRAHDVFHVEKLLPCYDRDPVLFPMADDPMPDDEPVTDDLGDYYEQEYEVERLVSHRYDTEGNLQYQVRWSGFAKEHDTWQTLQDVASASAALQDYRQTLTGKARTRYDTTFKRMVREAQEGSVLKSGNVTEMFISELSLIKTFDNE